ncbi:redoxin domain-containing protein [Tautonia plasticadhaerens]|uniref:Thiol-disulfide oxidoreductase ResA n=1 Tax=Tautonia plasticadhaerens TaxID=2527974 RepID=A0A518H145_9BACT|nr:redoxin domain-containing protein [Tautonia plasticadhaerens]QDV34569.1 Thiol-disulfide oxidoreductase ResA [Tautonia plasticadhaerens]
MSIGSTLALIALASAAVVPDDGGRTLRGRVVDESGTPVAGAEVAPYWFANGSHRKPDGSAFDLSDPEELRRFWGDLGRMEPSSSTLTATDDDGAFFLELGRRTHHVLVLDGDRRRGAVGLIPVGGLGDEPIEIRLRPLVRVRGRMALPGGGRPDWTHIYTMLPDDPTRPVDSTRVAGCGSFSSEFEMLLPPGDYRFNAYGISEAESDVIDVRVLDAPSIHLTGAEPEVDLGTLTLSPVPPREQQIAEAAADGFSGDYREHYGRRPPRIEAVAGRGIDADAQPWDFPGKWVLIVFWGFDCPSCLIDHMPELIAFHEEHGDRLDRFQVLSVFIDTEGEVATVPEFERRLRPFVEHVWDGKDLPFPVLIDPSLRSWSSYSLDGFPTVLLIDPEGHLVEGDLSTLGDRLSD